MTKKIEYYVPIEESFMEETEGNFLIRGTAINSCTTRNGVEYKAEELMLSAQSLRDKPVLKDHINSVDSIVGRTTQNVSFDVVNSRVPFEARITDPSMQEKIRRGDIKNVSIGAMVQSVKKESENGALVARGIDFVEISLVAVPADPNAGFAKALMEAFQDKTEIKEEVKMDEEKTKILESENVVLAQKVKEYEEREMNSLRETYKTLCVEKKVTMKAGYESLSKEVLEVLIETLKSIKVAEKSEVKGEVTQTEVVESPYLIENNGKTFSLGIKNLGEMSKVYER